MLQSLTTLAHTETGLVSKVTTTDDNLLTRNVYCTACIFTFQLIRTRHSTLQVLMAYTQNKEFVEFRRSDKNNNKNNIKKSKLIWELPVLETPQD